MALEAELTRLREELAGLRRAMEHRATIGQAKGIVMSRLNCSPEMAMDVLKKRSMVENRKLADVAAEFVRTRGHRVG